MVLKNRIIFFIFFTSIQGFFTYTNSNTKEFCLYLHWIKAKKTSFDSETYKIITL